mmetsp:Transcript_750/g.777  ORF Transcript_750/g.777 Transcript_750/m.777 type:complete len:273 (+) Transcript_750:159-977(+)
MNTPTTLHLYAITFSGALCCFIPYLLYDFREVQSKSLYELSNIFQFHLIGAISVISFLIILCFFETLIDSFLAPTISLSSGVKPSLWILLMTFLFALSIIFFYLLPFGLTTLIPCIVSSSIIILTSVCLSSLHIYGPIIWRYKYILLIIFFETVLQVCHSFLATSYIYSSSTSYSILLNISYVFELLCIVIFLWLLVFWCYHLILNYPSQISLSNLDHCCTINIIIILLFFILQLCFKIFICENQRNRDREITREREREREREKEEEIRLCF